MKNYISMTDAALVELCLQRDDGAFAELVQRHKKSVLGTAYKVTGSSFYAEDASQDAFVSAWMNLHALSDGGKFRPWVCAIAKNCARRLMGDYGQMFSTISLDTSLLGDVPDFAFDGMEKSVELGDAVERLSEKVREAVVLHYVEGYKISEIAEKLSVSEYAVRWRLSEGRKMLRKGYGVIEETYIENEDLLTRVMRQVENLKLWLIRDDKTGFKEEYEKVLDAVNTLPESKKKDYLLADAMLVEYSMETWSGFDEVKKLKEIAEKGRNEDAMSAVIPMDVWSMVHPYTEHITIRELHTMELEVMKKFTLPYLEKHGFRKAMGRTWKQMALYYGFGGDYRAEYDALKTALEYFCEDDPEYKLISRALKECDALMRDGTFDAYMENKKITVNLYVLKKIDGSYRMWDGYEYVRIGAHKGETSVDGGQIFHELYGVDAVMLFPEQVGSFRASEKKNSYIVSNDDSVGEYDSLIHVCNRVALSGDLDDNSAEINFYFKKGVGIVCEKRNRYGYYEGFSLVSHNVNPSDSYFPMDAGNKWNYAYRSDIGEIICTDVEVEVVDNTGDTVVLLATSVQKESEIDTSVEGTFKYLSSVLRHRKYTEYLKTGRPLLESALEKCTDRMMKKNLEYLKKYGDSTALSIDTGDEKLSQYCMRNVLDVIDLENKDGEVLSIAHRLWLFEHHNGEANSTIAVEYHKLRYADFISILAGTFDKLWSRDWKPGYCETVFKKIFGFDCEIRFHFIRDGESVTTPAGTFENCLHMQIDVRNLPGMYMPYAYRGGWMDYWFAPGVGIVQYFHLLNNEFDCYWQLTEYNGAGEGYFPTDDGLTRRYEPLDLKLGYHSSLEIEFVSDGKKTSMYELIIGTQDADEYRKVDGVRLAEKEAAFKAVTESIEK